MRDELQSQLHSQNDNHQKDKIIRIKFILLNYEPFSILILLLSSFYTHVTLMFQTFIITETLILPV